MDIEPRLVSSENEEVVVEPTLAAYRSSAKSVWDGLDINRALLPASILLSTIIISASLLYIHGFGGGSLLGNSQQAAGDNGGAKAPTGPVKVDIGDSPTLGNANAPVKIIEFADFQCPFCKRYFDQNESSIIKDYVNTGKAVFVWKDYAFLGQESTWAAEAARCAKDQGKFWQYHDYLYAHQGQENSGTFTKSKLEGFAASLGLNTAQFNSCLNSDKYASDVQKEQQYGSSVGVQGTPATFINGVLVSGAVPYATLKAAIDAALK